MKTQPAWTEAERTEVVRRWNEGESAAELAKDYSLTRNGIIGRLDRMRKSGIFIRSASDKPTMPTPEKRKRIRKVAAEEAKAGGPANWQKEETDTLVEKWNQGMGEAALATLLDRSLYSVRARVARMVSIGRCQRGSQRSTKLARPVSFAPPYAAKRDENRISLFTANGRGTVQAFEEKMPGVGVSIMQLGRFSCRFVTGTDLFCGEKVQRGSYCEACRPRVYLGAA